MYKVTTKIEVKIFLPESLYTTQHPTNHIYFSKAESVLSGLRRKILSRVKNHLCCLVVDEN